MAETFSRTLLKIAVAQICQGLGWHAVQTTPCEILTDVCERYIKQLAQCTHRYSEQYGKTDPTIEDLGLALHDMGFSINELNTYIKEVEPIPFAKAVPCYPLPKSNNFQHPAPGSKHCRERLHYIPDYLPPLVSIKGDADTSDIVEPDNHNHSSSTNGVNHDGTDANQKSPETTGPNYEGLYTPPRPEKRSLQSSYGGEIDSKRMRRVEDGTPQELVTVTMEPNGILTPKREGKLPDACTPPPKFTEKLKLKSSLSSPSAEKIKGSIDVKKSTIKDAKKSPKETSELKKVSNKSDSKKHTKDVSDTKKCTVPKETNDSLKSVKTLKTPGKKSPKPSQGGSPASVTPPTKLKPSQKSPKPSFSIFSSDSSFKYPTKKSSAGTDKTEVGSSSKSPKTAPRSPHISQTAKKSDSQMSVSKSTKKSDVYDFDDDDFDSPVKDKAETKVMSPLSAGSSLNAMQAAFKSAVAKSRLEMELDKTKQSTEDSTTKGDSSPLMPKTSLSDASYDAVISAVIKKKQENTSLEKSKETYLPSKIAFKKALREEQEAKLRGKKDTPSKLSSVKKVKKIKKGKEKGKLHSIKNKVIKKSKKIQKSKEKKLKVATVLLDGSEETNNVSELTFKLKTSGGETTIVKEKKELSLKLAPIPKLNIKRKDSTSLQVVQVQTASGNSKNIDKKKDKKSKEKLKKKKKLKQKTLQENEETKKKKVPTATLR